MSLILNRIKLFDKKIVPEKMQETIKSKIPSGKFGDPTDILNAVNFLIASEYINGEAIDINGGLI